MSTRHGFEVRGLDVPRGVDTTQGNQIQIYDRVGEQYAERVQRTAPRLAALGVRRSDTVALILINRPAFHGMEVASMHLGATTFDIYNTFAHEQVEHVLRYASGGVDIPEHVFAERPTVALRTVQCVPIDSQGESDGQGSA